MSLLKQLNF